MDNKSTCGCVGVHEDSMSGNGYRDVHLRRVEISMESPRWLPQKHFEKSVAGIGLLGMWLCP